MPRAGSRETARQWATERAIDVWAFVAGDLGTDALAALEPSIRSIRADGAAVVAVRPPGAPLRPDEIAVSDGSVQGEIDGLPMGLFRAVEAAGGQDVRRLGVVGASTLVLDAAARAGAGAIVGIAAADPAERRGLLAAQPDAIVEPDELGGLDAERYGSRRAHRQRVLLNPGPAVVSDRVHRAVAGPDLCHREPEYAALFGRVRSKLLAVAGVADDWSVALIGGSGTAAMEAMVGAAVRPGRRLLVCRNGVYGDRLATIADRLGVLRLEVLDAHTEPIRPEAVARALDADPTIDAVAIVHHETTTGLLNPIHEVAAVASERGVMTIADAISSFGGERLDLAAGTIDVVAGTSNKCLHGLPGVSFLLLSPRASDRAAQVPPRSLYFDIPNYLRAQARSTVPFTPPVPAIYGLEAALDELADEGPAHRLAHYRERGAFMDRELGRLGLEPIVAPEHRSSSVRSVPLPAGVTYRALHDAVRDDGYVIYAGLGQAAGTNFRVCTLGALEIEALAGFTDSLERALARLGAGGAGGAGMAALAGSTQA